MSGSEGERNKDLVVIPIEVPHSFGVNSDEIKNVELKSQLGLMLIRLY